MSSRSLSDLHPVVHRMANAMLRDLSFCQVDVIVTCTYRSPEEQSSLYACGRGSDTRPIITRAPAGYSLHNYRLALDVVPLVHGKPCWDPRASVWQTVGRVGEGVGFEWAGRWPTFREMPHFQWLGGLTLADLLAGRQVPEDAVPVVSAPAVPAGA